MSELCYPFGAVRLDEATFEIPVTARTGMRVIDLVNPERFEEKLKFRIKENNEILKASWRQTSILSEYLAGF